MQTAKVKLTDTNREKLDMMPQHTGKTRDELLNEAVEPLVPEPNAEFEAWRSEMERAAGIWKNRDDIPALMAEVRREMDHVGESMKHE